MSFMDDDLCFSDVNASFRQMIGYTRKELIGRPLYDFCEQPLTLALPKPNTPSSTELAIRRKCGMSLWVRLHLHRLDAHPDQKHRYVAIKESIHEHKRLELLASIDPLTQLYNRGHFNTLLERELSRLQRSAHPASLVLCDIDDFKKLNDTHGHLFGDKALAYVAQTIAQSIRRHDVAARWGGEEFIILLPDTQLEQALHVAQKIRLALAHAEFQKTVTVTASFGVAQLRRQDSAVSWFHRTDEALYRAKQAGKNRVAH